MDDAEAHCEVDECPRAGTGSLPDEWNTATGIGLKIIIEASTSLADILEGLPWVPTLCEIDAEHDASPVRPEGVGEYGEDTLSVAAHYNVPNLNPETDATDTWMYEFLHWSGEGACAVAGLFHGREYGDDADFGVLLTLTGILHLNFRNFVTS